MGRSTNNHIGNVHHQWQKNKDMQREWDERQIITLAMPINNGRNEKDMNIYKYTNVIYIYVYTKNEHF